MGVAIIGGLAAVGIAGGLMGSMGQQQQQMAQYHAQRMEAEKQNYLNQKKTDDQNWMNARKAALTRINNKKIAESAVKMYADMKLQNRKTFQSNVHGMAEQWLNARNAMITEATGKNLRGGMVERMGAVAAKKASEQRLQMRQQYAQSDEVAKNKYAEMLNQRDMLTRYGTAQYVPGQMPVKPESGFTLGMLGSMLSGGASGASMGANIAGALG